MLVTIWATALYVLSVIADKSSINPSIVCSSGTDEIDEGEIEVTEEIGVSEVATDVDVCPQLNSETARSKNKHVLCFID